MLKKITIGICFIPLSLIFLIFLIDVFYICPILMIIFTLFGLGMYLLMK